jgi:hypothetical protein
MNTAYSFYIREESLEDLLREGLRKGYMDQDMSKSFATHIHLPDVNLVSTSPQSWEDNSTDDQPTELSTPEDSPSYLEMYPNTSPYANEPPTVYVTYKPQSKVSDWQFVDGIKGRATKHRWNFHSIKKKRKALTKNVCVTAYYSSK